MNFLTLENTQLSKLITFYLLLTDRKSKTVRWFYKNSKNIKPPKNTLNGV